MSSNSVEHDLTAHGLAFLERSVTSMRGSDERGALFAIVDLAVAIEALLKARLVREHWSLICADPDKATYTKFETGQAKTVSTAQAVRRLEGIAGLPMTALGHNKRIDQISALRNRAVHFTVPAGDSSIGLRTAYGHALNFALWLLDEEFRQGVDHDTEVLVDEVIENLSTEVRHFESLVSDRMTMITVTLEQADICLECPRCEQPALMFNEHHEWVYCGYCLWSPEDGSMAAEEYVEAVLQVSLYRVIKDGDGEDGWPIWECPRCAIVALVSGVQQKRPDPRHPRSTGYDAIMPAYWACFQCGWSGPAGALEHCAICNAVAEGDTDGTTICVNCVAARIGED
ncbi:hypothetical protein CYJ73_21285 [Gordonia terrae]|uniref:Uncharacterized protein n=1 Tax=Gordonia terrae TaxID=2055 RepID=A0A2I1R396_9ACTN|nr:hypothetical protein [Gordonia terrae]PKZ63595.1 hypothetical protein CYJ73_21285 [Gordonia terrae]